MALQSGGISGHWRAATTESAWDLAANNKNPRAIIYSDDDDSSYESNSDSSMEPDEEEGEDFGEISEEAEVCVSDLCGNCLVPIGS